MKTKEEIELRLTEERIVLARLIKGKESDILCNNIELRAEIQIIKAVIKILEWTLKIIN